jgi:GTP diphosphokinase / guanosine-3',5'-bis(diphosphate) 3'-diphosphatase
MTEDTSTDCFADLGLELNQYLDQESIDTIYQAYLCGKEAHQGQTRASGEPYITHPVAVARILAEMRMGPETIMAAILHDVIEDTLIDKATLVERFGEQVAELVDGVSKLTQIKFESRAEAQAENFRKMVLAMAQDLRVIVVKLADRIHNMRTLSVLRPEKRRRIAAETLEIYAPIANRLGMHNFCIEFEDLGFSALYPMRYRVLKEAVKKAHGNRRQIINVIETALQECLAKQNIKNCSVWGREKHLYSIYKKMLGKHLSFSDIMDVYAFRIVVDSVDDCYRTLGAVHNLYKPVPERFKDYIAIPKANGYQSLHTILFGPYGVPIEIQIRTVEMEQMAECGIAAHWLYKADAGVASGSQMRAQEWLKSLLELQQSVGSSLEFIENVKIDLFPDEVFVFTPKGNILELQNGASVIDFAYSIHTDIGNTCVAAKIDRRLAPLSTVLNNGQTVEIITSETASPNPAWLNFVVTGKARTAIRHYLKKQRSTESIALGQRLLERALHSMSTTIEEVDEKNISNVLLESHFQSLDDLYEAIGMGRQVSIIVARRLTCATNSDLAEEQTETDEAKKHLSQQPLIIVGTEGMAIRFAHCCKPIPGDVILGVLEVGRGIIVHREQCRRINTLRQSEKCVFLSWGEQVTGDFAVDLKIQCMNRRGVLATLAKAFADVATNIENISVEEGNDQYSFIYLTISVKNRVHLAKAINKVRVLKTVSKITREK